jgi:hypothetical protein
MATRTPAGGVKPTTVTASNKRRQGTNVGTIAFAAGSLDCMGRCHIGTIVMVQMNYILGLAISV